MTRLPIKNVPALGVSLSAFSEALYQTWRPGFLHNPSDQYHDRRVGDGKPITIGLAISGGVDSMALASLCSRWLKIKEPIMAEKREKVDCDDVEWRKRLRLDELRLTGQIRFQGFVVDHGVREGSREEARSVREMLEGQEVPTKILTIKWPNGNSPAGQANFESLARKYRFQELGLAGRSMGISSLFLAHHQDDQAETVLMRMIDGHRRIGLTGMERCAGIPECFGMYGIYESGGSCRSQTANSLGSSKEKEKRGLEFEFGGIKIHRPLLSFSKSQLKATCLETSTPWFEDHTNADATLTRRNAIRHLFTHYSLPGALSKPSILNLSQKLRSNRDLRTAKAEKWFRERCQVINFDNRAGTIRIRIPVLSQEDEKDVAGVLLRRIVSLVSPLEHVYVSALEGALGKVFPGLFLVPSEKEVKETRVFTVAGVQFELLPPPPSKENEREEGEGEEYQEWFLSRQPHPSKSSTRPLISIPPSLSPSTHNTHNYALPWTLYDGRFWVRFNLSFPTTSSCGNLSIRPLTPGDIHYIRRILDMKERKEKRKEFEALLKKHAPGNIRWSLPVLIDQEGRVLGLVSLGWRVDDDNDREIAREGKSGWDIEVRYKKLNL